MAFKTLCGVPSLTEFCFPVQYGQAMLLGHIFIHFLVELAKTEGNFLSMNLHFHYLGND